MPNNLFLPSNEPAQAAMRNITATRASNALTQQTQLENQRLQSDMQRRMELETVLRTSENPERAGYEWAKRNDQKLYTDLSKFYLERFVAKLDMDENAAQKELENATGETMLIGERYIAPFKDAAGNPDPAQGLIDKITKRFFQPDTAEKLAQARMDFERAKQAAEQAYGYGKQEDQQKFEAEQKQLDRESREKNAKIGASARLARPRAIQTVDEEGEPVTRFVSAAEGAEYPMAPTATMREKKQARTFVGKNIDELEALSRRVITEKQAIVQRAKATGRTAEALLANDPDFRVYQDARMALAGNLAVAQQGSRPSDADIKAIWLPLVPDVFRDTQDSMNMKWQMIKSFSNIPGSTGTALPAGQREINGVLYEKVQGGWRKVKK
jgi:hypothetical protein